MSTNLTGLTIMNKTKLREIEIKLNPKTNGFELFKENFGVPTNGSTFGDSGLEAETNILPPKGEDDIDEEIKFPMRSFPKDHDTVNGLGGIVDNIAPPTEHEFDEGLNLVKKIPLQKGDKVIVKDIPRGVAMNWLNDETGELVTDRRYNEDWKIDVGEVVFDKFEIGTYAVPFKALQRYNPQSEISEGLNLVKRFKEGDEVMIYGFEPGNQLEFLNGVKGNIMYKTKTEYLDPDVYRIHLPNSETWYIRPEHLKKISNEVTEGLNLVKKLKFKVGDEVIVDAPKNAAFQDVHNKTGIIVNVHGIYNYTVDINDQNWWVPVRYLKKITSPESEIQEVSPYEESDWLISESHKKETEQISEWLKTTPEPYDHFHWDGADLLILKEGKVIETVNRSMLAQNQIISEIRQLNENHKDEYGCLMVDLDIPIWDEIMGLIDPEDLYTDEEGFGLEKKPHSTILFGLYDDEINLDDIKKELTGIDEVPVKIQKISHFDMDDPEKPYDVVKFDLESEMLHSLNSKMQKFPNTNEFPKYSPHMTIGYVRKGMGKKYDGELSSQPTVLGKHISYSHPSGKKDQWELPIKSDVINSDEDLMEGLNLVKRAKPKTPEVKKGDVVRFYINGHDYFDTGIVDVFNDNAFFARDADERIHQRALKYHNSDQLLRAWWFDGEQPDKSILQEGLNLMKKAKNAKPITRVFEIEDIDGSNLISFHRNELVNWDTIKDIEEWDGDWKNLKVVYEDFNGQEQHGVLGSFHDTYFRIGRQYAYMFDDTSLTIQPVNAYQIENVINNTTDQTIEATAAGFIGTVTNWINDVESELEFTLLDLIDDNHTVLNFYDINTPQVIILINGVFYNIDDEGISPTSVKPGNA